MTRTRAPKMGEVISLLTDKPLIELWVTEVGSAMWRMDTFASDHDLIVIYANRHYDVLTGKMTDTLPQRTDLTVDWADKPLDVAGMEIGHLVHLLKKGNVNAIWSVMSPQVVSSLITNPFHKDFVELRNMVMANPSTQTIYSVRGMAVSQAQDARKRAHVREPAKSYATAIRTLQFGITLLHEGKFQFIYPERRVGYDPEPLDMSEEITNAKFEELERALETTSLPSDIPEEPFDDYLYALRGKIAHIGEQCINYQGKNVAARRALPRYNTLPVSDAYMGRECPHCGKMQKSWSSEDDADGYPVYFYNCECGYKWAWPKHLG